MPLTSVASSRSVACFRAERTAGLAPARTPLSGTFEGACNTQCEAHGAGSRKRPAEAAFAGSATADLPPVRLKDVARDYMASNPGPMDVPAFQAYAEQRGVSHFGGLSMVVKRYRNTVPIAPRPPSNQPLIPPHASAMKAAIAWHDLAPAARQQQEIEKFAIDHGCTSVMMQRLVNRWGNFTPLMQRRLHNGTVVSDGNRHGNGAKMALAWNALGVADRKGVSMDRFASANFGKGADMMHRYVSPDGRFKPAMVPYLPPDHPYVLQQLAEDWAALEFPLPARNTAESETTRPVIRRGRAAPGFGTGRSVMEAWRNLPRDAAGKISRSAFARQFNLTGAALHHAMSMRRQEEGEGNAEELESLNLRDVAKAYFKSNPGAIDVKAFVEHATKLGVRRLTGIDQVLGRYARKFGVPAPRYTSCSGAASTPSGTASAHALDVARPWLSAPAAEDQASPSLPAAFTGASNTPVVTTPEELLAALGPTERTLLDDALRQFAEHGE